MSGLSDFEAKREQAYRDQPLLISRIEELEAERRELVSLADNANNGTALFRLSVEAEGGVEKFAEMIGDKVQAHTVDMQRILQSPQWLRNQQRKAELMEKIKANPSPPNP